MDQNNINEGYSAYIKAQRQGIKVVRAAMGAGKNPYLPNLEETVPSLNQLARVTVGIRTIPLSLIAGTVSPGRSSSFANEFSPLLDPETEFGTKWIHLYGSVMEEGLREPIKVLEYMNHYYAIEGNKRVSVLKALNAPDIEADISRVIPRKTNEKPVRIYEEYLAFLDKSGVYDLTFSEEGCYKELCALVGKKPDEKWEEMETLDFRSYLRQFSDILHKEDPARSQGNATDGDALLIYLRVFGYSRESMSEKQIRAGINKLRKELLAQDKADPVTLKMTPDGEKPGLLSQLIDRNPDKLNVCFINNRAPEVSGWAYWHKLGMLHVENALAGKIQTTMVNSVAADACEAAIDAAVKEGANVIFTTSPLLLDGAMKSAIRYPNVKILNCSLLPEYSTVRSYYLRMYEAKFIMGAVAGIVSDENTIGYIADYPVYGVPASINAFALGVQLTNPRAKIRLKWSMLKNCDPAEELKAEGVQVICNRDIAAPAYESTAFGLYLNQEDGIRNLIMPMWDWGRMYEELLRRIMTGMWKMDTGDQVLNYWWGMDSGAVDIIHSRRLAPGTQRLVELLRSQIAADQLKPFAGRIVSQDGHVRCHTGETMTPARILAMDWLCDNIEGTFPEADELKPEAQDFVRRQGIRTSHAPEENQINVEEK